MGTINVTGRLRHHFWGNYHATIALDCGSPEGALDVLDALGGSWEVGNNPACLVTCEKDPELEATLSKLESFGADRKKMTSIAKSIDKGEVFTLTVVTTPREQMKLFAA